MDKETQEKLEQELRFLKESFDAEVISKDEYEKGKDRIEKKLQGDENSGNDNELKNHETEKKEETKTESTNQVKSEEITEAKKYVETQQLPAETKEQKKEDKKDNKSFKYAIVFVVLTLIVFFGYSLLKQNKALEKEETKAAQLIPVCSSDKDCIQSSRQGVCLNSGTKNAKCQYSIKKTKVIVLNDKNNCFNCGTERILGIIENWFGPLDAKEVDYNTEQGKEFADKFGLKMLPAYIFYGDITNKTAYNQIRQTFVNKNGNYILSDNAAASTFYFRRENIPNKLDFFVKEGDSSSTMAEKNLKEFLEAFQNVEFEKHSSTSDLAKELGIKTFPAFLVNNQIKFSGIHSSETIKENFCSLNKLEECGKELSDNLVQ